MPQAHSKTKSLAGSSSKKEANQQQQQKKHKGKTDCNLLCQICNNCNTSKKEVASIVMALIFNRDTKHLLRVLLDTGALQGNYIS